MKLWRYNRITGYWIVQRAVNFDTATRWLAIFERDEPGESFLIGSKRPTRPPVHKRGR
jgi:hypothetical protein